MYDFLQGPAANTMAGSRKQGKSAQLKRFISELIQVASNTGTSLFTESQLRDLHGALQMATAYPFGELLEALNQHGYILKKGPGQFKLSVT